MLVIVEIGLWSVFWICDQVLLLWCESVNAQGHDTQDYRKCLELHFRLDLGGEGQYCGSKLRVSEARRNRNLLPDGCQALVALNLTRLITTSSGDLLSLMNTSLAFFKICHSSTTTITTIIATQSDDNLSYRNSHSAL